MQVGGSASTTGLAPVLEQRLIVTFFWRYLRKTTGIIALTNRNEPPYIATSVPSDWSDPFCFY